jgi:hypothetical protein
VAAQCRGCFAGQKNFSKPVITLQTQLPTVLTNHTPILTLRKPPTLRPLSKRASRNHSKQVVTQQETVDVKKRGASLIPHPPTPIAMQSLFNPTHSSLQFFILLHVLSRPYLGGSPTHRLPFLIPPHQIQPSYPRAPKGSKSPQVEQIKRYPGTRTMLDACAVSTPYLPRKSNEESAQGFKGQPYQVYSIHQLKRGPLSQTHS